MQNEMRKTIKKSLAVVLSAAMLLGAASVTPVAQAAPKAKKITLNAKSKKLTVGQKFTLKVKKVTPAKAKKTVTWKTSKKTVATVSKKGVVKAVKAGKANITATSKANKKVKAVCKVTVVDKVQPTQAPVEPTPTPALTTAPAPTNTPEVTEAPTATPERTQKPTPTPYVLPKEALKENADFKVGTVINYDKTQDKSFTALAAQQFDVVSFENEMKGYSLIDVGASAAAVADEGESVVKCQFDRADEMVKWAKDNGLKVRGHVLFWENSMAEAFFYQSYEVPSADLPAEEKEAKLVDKDTLKARMMSYAEQVINHFNTEFPDMVIAWDVVNEAVDGGDTAVKDDTTGLYLNNSGNFFKIFGGGEYIKYAFECAKAAVAKTKKDIQLFYNDFNCFQSPKTDRIVALINYLNPADGEKLLDCMGMEGYVLTYWPDANDVKKAMDKFAGLGVKVGINELCVRLSPTLAEDKTTVTDKDIEAHIKKCEAVFKVYCDFYKNHPDTLTNVSIWALTDRPDLEAEATKPDGERHYDYDVYGTHSGLFTYDLAPKAAFDAVIQVLKDNK